MTIQIPKKYYPTFVSHKKQTPIVIVPEIIYPRKTKRVVVHHEAPMTDYYKKMAYNSINPHFFKFAGDNPAYKEGLKQNAFYQTALKNQMYKGGVDKIPPQII